MRAFLVGQMGSLDCSMHVESQEGDYKARK